MIHPLTSSFDRPFESKDADLFQELVRDLIGARLSRWRESYAEGIVLDFGELVARRTRSSDTIPNDRGEWMISTWGCDIVIREGQSASQVEEFGQVKRLLAMSIGRRLLAASLDPADLSLRIDLEGDTQIYLRTDHEDPQLDQWFIMTPSGASIGVSASRSWYFREPPQ